MYRMPRGRKLSEDEKMILYTSDPRFGNLFPGRGSIKLWINMWKSA